MYWYIAYDVLLSGKKCSPLCIVKIVSIDGMCRCTSTAFTNFLQLPLGWPETGYSTEGRCPSIPYCPSRFWNPLHVVNSMGLTNVLSLVKQALQMRRVSLGSATISRSANINVPMDNKCLVVDLRSSLETKDLVICFAQSYPLYLYKCSFLLGGPNLLFGRLQHPES